MGVGGASLPVLEREGGRDGATVGLVFEGLAERDVPDIGVLIGIDRVDAVRGKGGGGIPPDTLEVGLCVGRVDGGGYGTLAVSS